MERPESHRRISGKGESQKLAAIPELVAATVSGDYDSNTLDHLEDILGSYAGSEAAGKALAGAFSDTKILTSQGLKLLKDFYDQNKYKAANHWLENKKDSGWGEVLAGANILAYGAINKWAETPKKPTGGTGSESGSGTGNSNHRSSIRSVKYNSDGRRSWKYISKSKRSYRKKWWNLQYK